MEMESIQNDLPADDSELVVDAETTEENSTDESDESNIDADENETEVDASDDDEAAEESKEKKEKNHRDRRIERTFAENSYMRARLEMLEQQLQQRLPQQQENVVDDTLRPDPKNFEPNENGYRQYMVEHQDWLARTMQREINALRSEMAPKAKPSVESEEFIKATPDFKEIITEAADIKFPSNLIPIIQQDKNSAAIHYYLAKNPEIALSFNKMTPAEALMELGSIKAQLKKPTVKSVAKKLTTGAAPVFKPPVAGTKEKKDPSKMSAKEWANYWNKKEGKVRNKTFI
jgi:hypothetical protein